MPSTGIVAKSALSIKKPSFAVTVTAATDGVVGAADTADRAIIKLSDPPKIRSSPQSFRLSKSMSMDVPASSPHAHDDEFNNDPVLALHDDEPVEHVVTVRASLAASTPATPAALESDV